MLWSGALSSLVCQNLKDLRERVSGEVLEAEEVVLAQGAATKVRVVSAGKPSYWYANMVGEEFEVLEPDGGSGYWVVRNLAGRDGISYSISGEDCEPVEEYSGTAHCHSCGMPCGNEYHPYAACLMFKQCRDRKTVEANLAAVVEYGALAERARIHEEWRKVFDQIGAAGQGGTAARLRAELDRMCPNEGRAPRLTSTQGEVGGITGLGRQASAAEPVGPEPPSAEVLDLKEALKAERGACTLPDDSEVAEALADPAKAQEWLERLRWPRGVPVCPVCDRAAELEPSRRKGARHEAVICKYCGKEFSVRLGTLLESTHLKLHQWIAVLWVYYWCWTREPRIEITAVTLRRRLRTLMSMSKVSGSEEGISDPTARRYVEAILPPQEWAKAAACAPPDNPPGFKTIVIRLLRQGAQS
jgi:transposase-like protein